MRGSHAPMAALGVAAILAVALGGLAAAQSPSPASAVPGGSPVAAASAAGPAGSMSPVTIGALTWKEVDKGKDFTTNPAVYSVGQLPDGRLVVVGSVSKEPGQPAGAAWVSADGSSWKRLKGFKAPQGSEVYALTNLGTMTVATGYAGDTGAVWTSLDGDTWTKTAMSGVIYELTTTPTGLVGVGFEDGAATAWTSTDGVSWQATTLAPSGHALHVMTGPDGIVVATGAVTDAAGVETPVVWSSVDGTTWTQTTLPGLVPGQWSIPSAASTPAGMVATFSGEGGGHVWSSPDGVTWTETFVDDGGAFTAAGAAGTDALLIGHGLVLRSPDGVTWTPTAVKSFNGWNIRDVTTLADGRLFAAGDYGYPESVMATWTGTGEQLP